MQCPRQVQVVRIRGHGGQPRESFLEGNNENREPERSRRLDQRTTVYE